MNQLILALTMGLGLVACFAGYRLFRFFLAIGGLVSGVAIGWTAGLAASGGSVVVALVIAAILGLLGAALAGAVYFAGIFLLGANALAGLGWLLFGNPVAAIVLGILGGIVCIFVQKFAIIFATSFGGAAAAASAFERLFPARYEHVVVISAGIILGIVGLLVQLGMARAGRRLG